MEYDTYHPHTHTPRYHYSTRIAYARYFVILKQLIYKWILIPTM